MVWARRSGARKSVLKSPWSALSTTTSVTFGKSCPLVTICVPTRMRASPDDMRRMTSSSSPRRLTTSRSSRAMRTPGKSAASVSSMRSVPWPTGFTAKPHCRQRAGSGASAPQW